MVNSMIIDIKDMNADIYQKYTGKDNRLVMDNLQLIADQGRQDDCIIRLPLIPNFNTDADRTASRTKLGALGFTHFDLFTYQIRNNYGTGKRDL